MRLCARLSLFTSLLLAGSLAFAQITAQTGAISGRVTDPSGASIPAAKVTITSERGALQSKNTSDSGDYVFQLLEPGLYRLTVEAKGFSKASVKEVRVQITEVVNVPVQLEVGAETIEISVVGEATQINVTNATAGNVLPGSVIENMPLSTRNFTNLLGANAGTASTIPNASIVGRGSTTVFVNGQRGTMNNLVINGVDANNLGSNNFGSVPVPAPDTIEEFRVQTSMYDASQGKTSGGNVNVITKGGGPQYHGEAYEFFRNEKLNANDFFYNKQGVARGLLRQNQFGANFGGPVPGIKNTFFFGSYQGTRQLNGLSGAVVTAWPVIPEQRTAESVGAAFGLNPSQVDPVALKLLNVKGQFGGWAVPTGTGAAPGAYGQIAFSAPQRFNDDQFNTNGDHLFGDRHRLALRYFRAKGKTIDPFGGGQTLGFGQESPVENHLASVSENWTITPSAVNEVRVGFNRIITGAFAKEPIKLSDIGMTRFNSALYPGIPAFFPLDLNPGFGGISTNNDQAGYSNTFHFSDTLGYTRGKHSLRVGFEMRLYQINLYNNFASRGFMYFATFKDFVQGNIFQSFVGTGQTYRDFRAKDIGWYFQDDFKVSRKLTVNLGVRYDYLGPSVDKRNRIGNFDSSRLDAATLAAGGPGLQAGFILPEAADFGKIKGVPGVERSTLTEDNKKNFSPRVGFAYDLFGNGKTSIRGGYGIYYVRISNQTLLQLLTAAPFFQQSSIVNPGTKLSKPYPDLPVPSDFPIFPNLPAMTLNAAGNPVFSAGLLGLNPIQRNLRTPYAEHYNFSLSRQLPKQWTLELGYLGSQGVRLLQSLQVNQARLANTQNPIRGVTENTTGNVSARVGTVGFSSTGFNEVTGNGHSSFNAFTTTLTRRFNRMFVQGAYTFAKSIDNNSGSSTQDLGSSGGNHLQPFLQRGLSDFDRKHRLQATYRYELPGVGKGLLGYVTRNWAVGGTTTFQSSLPINFVCATCSTNVYGATTPLYPNLVGDFSQIMKAGDPRNYVDAGTSVFAGGILAAPPTLNRATITSFNAFGGPGDQSYAVTGQILGTMPRNPGLRGPFQSQWDFVASRFFPITEKVKVEFRSEFFNLFNHPYFTNPNSTVGSAAFGRYTAQSNAPRIIQFALKLAF